MEFLFLRQFIETSLPKIFLVGYLKCRVEATKIASKAVRTDQRRIVTVKVFKVLRCPLSRNIFTINFKTVFL
jgi:hypothetical protein